MNAQPSNRFSMTPWIILLACLATFRWLTWSASAQGESKQNPVEVKMRDKLAAAAKVLEGLAAEDKELIHEGAKVLNEISKAEVWQALNDSEYREHTQAFRSAIQRMDEAARESRFASAQLDWLDANKRCFDCHNQMRGTNSNAEK